MVDNLGDFGGIVTIMFQDGKAEGIYTFNFEKNDNLPLTTQKTVYKEYLAYLMLRFPLEFEKVVTEQFSDKDRSYLALEDAFEKLAIINDYQISRNSTNLKNGSITTYYLYKPDK